MTRKILIAAALLLASIAHVKAEDLPQVIITTSEPLQGAMPFFPGAGGQKEVAGHMKAGDYDGPIDIKLRGNSSLGFNQKKYTVTLIEEHGENREERDAALLGMPAHNKWVLLAPYNDVSMVRDPLAYQLWRDMGHWAPRTVMCEVTLNGDYRGIYILCEAIKRGAERVNISKLKKSDVSGRALTGGYLLRIDTFDETDATFTSKVPGIGEGSMSSVVTWSCIYPKKKNLQPEQFAYIQNYVDTVEQVIQSDYYADAYRGYARYIDVPSFVDYFIHTELSLNVDGYRRSAYFYKEKQKADGTGGKLFAGPVWDYNYAYGNSSLANGNKPEAWCFEGANNDPTPAMWQRLLQDPTFRKAVKQRYQKLRKSVLSQKAIDTIIDRQAQLLATAKERHFETYPELMVNEAQQQEFNFVGMFAAYRVSSYAEEINILKQWLANRLAFLDRNIARFDKDWEPRIQPLVERKMQMPWGM